VKLLVVFLSLFLALVVARDAGAQPPAPSQPPPRQGVAVLGMGAAKDEAYALARAVYASSLRPRNLDEIRARVLAGDPPPALSSKEVRELSELRASIKDEDAASRRVLASIAKDLNVAALLVVKVEAAAAGAAAPADDDAGAEAGAPAKTTSARLFLAEPGEFDAARYSPEAGADGPAAWKPTVASLERRFPGTPASAPGAAAPEKPAPTMRPEEAPAPKPFYASAWFWGAVGGAVLIGGIFFVASQDTSDDPIHLQMRVPR
jgi:hypothetical protein